MAMKRIILFLISIFTILFAQNSKSISGLITDGTKNIAFARVVIKGQSEFVFSGWDGKFTLENIELNDSVIITAWAEGYYNGQTKAVAGDTNAIITLHYLPEGDNENYKWLSPHPDANSPNNCGNCHSDVIVNQWQKNAHGQSAKNPFFFAMYNGTNMSGESAGEGFRKDFPESDGNCTLCHIPTASLETMKGVDPNLISGVDTNGVFCDFCHKIEKTDGFASTELPTKNYGVNSIFLKRPPEGEQIFFGPYVDVHEPDAFNPNIRKSEYCAPCHSGFFWNDYSYGSFVEWEQSPYPNQNIQCQTCHMAPDGITTNFAPGKGGIEREVKSIPSHLQPGSRDTTILKNSVTMKIETKQFNDTLEVKVIIINDKTGHHVPTDRPSRNLILLVDAVEMAGTQLQFIEGEKVPFWGGPQEGQPGKGFAKVLKENTFFNPRIPVPAWVEHSIYSDNRIAAMESDTSKYYFRIADFEKDISVNAKLLYRRFYKKWMDEKGMNIPDIEMENESVSFDPEYVSVNKTEDVPVKFYLEQNYPNPFNPETTIRFSIPEKSEIKLTIIDVNGQIVKSIIDREIYDAGIHLIKINMNENASGVYFYRLETKNNIETKKLILIK